MSSRRQARAGVKAAEARRDGLPAALASRHNEVWTDAAAVERLADAYQLEVRPRIGSVSGLRWFERFDAFREAWCRAEGLMDPRWGGHSIDSRRAREAGIDMSSSSRYRLRTLGGSSDG